MSEALLQVANRYTRQDSPFVFNSREHRQQLGEFVTAHADLFPSGLLRDENRSAGQKSLFELGQELAVVSTLVCRTPDGARRLLVPTTVGAPEEPSAWDVTRFKHAPDRFITSLTPADPELANFLKIHARIWDTYGASTHQKDIRFLEQANFQLDREIARASQRWVAGNGQVLEAMNMHRLPGEGVMSLRYYCRDASSPNIEAGTHN